MGYYQKHPYIDAQRTIIKHVVKGAAKRLHYWLFVRGKHCKSCCLRCKYYYECRKNLEAEREREAWK